LEVEVSSNYFLPTATAAVESKKGKECGSMAVGITRMMKGDGWKSCYDVLVEPTNNATPPLPLNFCDRTEGRTKKIKNQATLFWETNAGSGLSLAQKKV
jgi:hypothetical protein